MQVDREWNENDIDIAFIQMASDKTMSEVRKRVNELRSRIEQARTFGQFDYVPLDTWLKIESALNEALVSVPLINQDGLLQSSEQRYILVETINQDTGKFERVIRGPVPQWLAYDLARNNRKTISVLQTDERLQKYFAWHKTEMARQQQVLMANAPALKWVKCHSCGDTYKVTKYYVREDCCKTCWDDFEKTRKEDEEVGASHFDQLRSWGVNSDDL